MPIGALPAGSGKTMRFTGTTVLKVVDGLITEEIGLDDGVTVLQQLGLIKLAEDSPPPRASPARRESHCRQWVAAKLSQLRRDPLRHAPASPAATAPSAASLAIQYWLSRSSDPPGVPLTQRKGR